MTAARKLDPTPATPADPVLAAFLHAPLSNEPESDEERAAFERGMDDIRAGRARSIGRDEMAETLERLRQTQGE
jgi:hypothetical protein